MSLISLSEFQKLVQLSDQAILWLLKNNRIPCQIGPDGAISVNTSGIEVKSLVQAVSAMRTDFLDSPDEVLLEKCARILSAHLDEISEEAIRALEQEDGGYVEQHTPAQAGSNQDSHAQSK